MKNLETINVVELSLEDKLSVKGGTDWTKVWKLVKEVFDDLDYAAGHIVDGWKNPK